MSIQQISPVSTPEQGVPSKPIAPTAPAAGGVERQSLDSGGKVVPVAAGEESRIVSREELSASVSRLNDYARDINRDLKFSLDEELNRVIVRVYNAETDELIRQIPSEEVLAMARHLARDEGIILDAEV